MDRLGDTATEAFLAGPLERAARDTGGDAALVWSRSGRTGGALVLGGHPVGVPNVVPRCVVPDDAGHGATVRDTDRLIDLLPAALLARLPATPRSARTVALGDDIFLTLIWCESGHQADDLDPQRFDELRRRARWALHLHLVEADVERLRAVVNGLQDAVVIVDPGLDVAAANQAAADLLGIPPGKNPAPEFDAALEALSRRALNHAEVSACLQGLLSDPATPIECMWRFPGQPSHLWVVSRQVRHRHFEGRTWVFYNESQSAHALESAERANALLRASADGMLDPQALLEAVRDDNGEVVDFVYRDVNRATGAYLGLAPDELIGRTLLETMPNLKPSGLLARYARCVDTHEPMLLDDVPYDNEILAGPRRYDIRGNYAGGDLMTLTWSDVTERYAAAQRVVESEERFRLLAENSGDVVAHIREDGLIVWVSPSVQEVLGAPPDHWIGQDMRATVPPDELDNQAAIVGRILAGEDVVARSRVLSVDGVTHWIHLHGRVFRNADGERDGLTVAFRVIDDEVRMAEEAEEARRLQADADARYRRLMDNSAVGMCLVTPDGRYESVNQALCDFFGYDADTIRTKTWQELTAGDTLERDLRNAEDMLAGRIDRYRVEKQYIHADGHLIWADLSVSCLRDDQGQVEYFVSQIVDITAAVENRRQIAQRDMQNRSLAQRLQAQTDRLRSELKIAGAYVRSLLPGELDGRVRVSRRYLPSRELGGDSFDYRWLDHDHLLVYLIDVSGHGIAPALESISVHNLLRSGSLPAETLLEPSRVLAELNSKFQMDDHGGNYFTMWYGIYQASTRALRYSSAGHPPVLAFPAAGSEPDPLTSEGLPIGMFSDTAFGTETYVVQPGSALVLYSDGAFELPVPDGATWSLTDFTALCTALARRPDWTVDELAEKLQSRTVAGLFEDDCSLVLLRFD